MTDYRHTDHEFEKLPKLVRDRIPEIMNSKGQIPVTHIAEESEFLDRLLNKLVEESLEALHAYNQEELLKELADVKEVLETLISLKGLEKIIQIQDEKRTKNGGFKERIILDDKK